MEKAIYIWGADRQRTSLVRQRTSLVRQRTSLVRQRTSLVRPQTHMTIHLCSEERGNLTFSRRGLLSWCD